MKVGIIGCGLIGRKRANSIKGNHVIVGLCDIDIKKANALAQEVGCPYVTDNYKELIEKEDIEIIVVSTLNNQLAPITLDAVQCQKHVIVEKPGGICSKELEPIMDAVKETDIKVAVGFNHRYHPALLKAKELIGSKELGEIMFIRGRYGHGGRVGYDKEWRSHAKLSGGGETIDQGVHLIDLARWFMGDFNEISGFAATYFWNMPVDDNGFICMKKDDKRAAWLQVSCTEWKNMFSFEIYCKKAKLMVEGLGGSYGVEKLSYYKMLPEMGPPETIIYEFPRGDSSWTLEFEDFVHGIEHREELKTGTIKDAYEALKIVEKIYAKR